MNKPFISYLVSCKNEGYQLQMLLEQLYKYKDDNECVILDDCTTDSDTLSVLNNVRGNEFFHIYQHGLNNNYSAHKNHGKDLCIGQYIFQLDADEIPSNVLMENLKEIIYSNPTVDLFWLPRINKFSGVEESHARQWGWDIDNPNKWVNWNGGDYQGRLFRNVPYLKWERPLHEKIEGARVSTKLPKEEDFAIIHTKTIEKQIATNLRYNKDFSGELNRGFTV